MGLTGPVLAFASLAVGQDVTSGLTAVSGGFASDLADGASVITSAVANPGDAFETITSNIGGADRTATSNIDGAFETTTSKVENALDDDGRNDVSCTSGEDTSQNGTPTALSFVAVVFVAAGVTV
jgi:hypothetical protein